MVTMAQAAALRAAVGMTIRWHRREFRDDQNRWVTSYYTEDRDWAAWSIDRIPCSNGSRTYWAEWQPMYHGEPMGLRQDRLRDAPSGSWSGRAAVSRAWLAAGQAPSW